MNNMRIHVLPDIHLEFQRWRRNWDIQTIDCDVHVLAGGRLMRAGKRLTWRKVVEWHRIAREFLERELPKRGDWDRTVIVTHHAPSAYGVEEPTSPDHLDAAYASPLDHLIPLADCWIHGHVHRADDYSGRLGGRVIRNARGYADTGYDAVDGFQWNRVVSL